MDSSMKCGLQSLYSYFVTPKTATKSHVFYDFMKFENWLHLALAPNTKHSTKYLEIQCQLCYSQCYSHIHNPETACIH